MQAWGISAPDLERAADAVGVRLQYVERAGRALRFRLATVSGGQRAPIRYGRRGYSRNKDGGRRRVPGAVCWHGHRDFMRELFRAHPEARIKSALANYRGADDFERKFPETADRQAGSMMDPVTFAELCDCDDAPVGADSQLAASELLRTARVRLIRRSDVLACAHVIMVPEHYREDGTCRCNDPNHLTMQEWGYTWDGGRWDAPDTTGEDE